MRTYPLHNGCKEQAPKERHYEEDDPHRKNHKDVECELEEWRDEPGNPWARTPRPKEPSVVHPCGTEIHRSPNEAEEEHHGFKNPESGVGNVHLVARGGMYAGANTIHQSKSSAIVERARCHYKYINHTTSSVLITTHA